MLPAAYLLGMNAHVIVKRSDSKAASTSVRVTMSAHVYVYSWVARWHLLHVCMMRWVKMGNRCVTGKVCTCMRFSVTENQAQLFLPVMPKYFGYKMPKKINSNTCHPKSGLKVNHLDLVGKVSKVKTRWFLSWTWVGHHWLQRATLCTIVQRLLIICHWYSIAYFLWFNLTKSLFELAKIN